MTTTEDVLSHHATAITAGDVDEILADYADDSVVLIPGRIFRGRDEIRELMTEVVTDMLPPGSTLNMTCVVIEGDYAYIVWDAESEKFSFPMGTDTFVVRDGKIVFQTFAAHTVGK
jgi:ketosteroid isomerase-like protein